MIRFRTDEPDYSQLKKMDRYWTYTVYENEKEIVSEDKPALLEKRVTTTRWFDANLLHGMLLGESISGVILYFNGTPMEYFLKKQETVKTATYGTEFLAARKCVEQKIIELKIILDFLKYL